MLSEEECEEALNVIEQATNEVEDYNSIPKVYFNQFAKEIDVIKQLIKEHFEPQAYKLEELKEGMWVWDNRFKEVCYISSIVDKNKIYVEYIKDYWSIEPYKIMLFEENRFFPVQMANREVE